MKLMIALIATTLLWGCGTKEETPIAVQSDVPASSELPVSESGVGTAVRKIGEIKKN